MHLELLTPTPYGEMMCASLGENGLAIKCDHGRDQVETIINAMVGTKQCRLGASPPPDVISKLRDVVNHHLMQNAPIQFLAPWGSQKPEGDLLDLAELMGLRSMHWLQKRVQEVYPPGVRIRIRMDDASAPHLFHHQRATETRAKGARYCADLTMLVQILGFDDHIETVKESSLVSEEVFNRLADEAVPFLEHYLREPSDANHDALSAMGWVGRISEATTDYYLKTFGNLYPGMEEDAKLRTLARYFAGSLARKRANAIGNDPSWGDKFLEFSLLDRIPGVEGYFTRRLYFRTVPAGVTRWSMPPWRAKGCFEMREGRPELTLSTHRDPRRFTENYLSITNGDNQITLRCDTAE